MFEAITSAAAAVVAVAVAFEPLVDLYLDERRVSRLVLALAPPLELPPLSWYRLL